MIREYGTRDEASQAVAGRILDTVQRRLDVQKLATLVVSGGTTPVTAFETLSVSKFDWPRVNIVLSDERWVPVDDADSNERLVRDTLLREQAARARFLPVYDRDSSIEDRCRKLSELIHRHYLPFACALLGMGSDGHFASLFADAENVDDGLELDSTTMCVPVTTAASPHPRVSLTLSALSRSDEILLLFFGDEKRSVYDKALQSKDGLPLSHLLLQKRAPVTAYWAP
jgi:6-phosphogluconolactonase